MARSRGTLIAVILAVGCAQVRQLPTGSVTESPVASGESPTGSEREPGSGDVDELLALLANPEKDPKGTRRNELAAELRTSADPRAIDALIATLELPPDSQPVLVYRQAVTSLGVLRASGAIDPILAAVFSVPDTPSTTSLVERAKVALASIGVDAVPRIVSMLKGEHAGVNRAVQLNGIPTHVVEATGLMMLAAFEHPNAVETLLDKLHESKSASEGPLVTLRVIAIDALGKIGSSAAVGIICDVLRTNDDPQTAYLSAQALGYIGGKEAEACLIRTIQVAEYSADAVASRDLVHELRWETVRLAALAGGAAAARRIRTALVDGLPLVRQRAQLFEPMLGVLETCGHDVDCLQRVLAEPSEDPFTREAAAFALARVEGEAPELAVTISKAFQVQDPDVRLSMALLVRRLGRSQGCPACADEMLAVLDAERGHMQAAMQAAVLEARVTIAVVSGADSGRAYGT